MRVRHRSCFAFGLLLLLLIVLASPARAFTADDIPSPRPAGWVVDLTGTLPIDTVTELNRLGGEVKTRTGAELAVVVIPTTGGADPHGFATHLFNTWGIGERDKDNGVLVFTALDDHAVEIVLGDGLDGESGSRESAAILQEEMIPRFRAGDPAGAILQGARACARRILGVGGAEAPAPSPAPAPQPFQPEPLSAPQPAYQPPPVPSGVNIGVLFALGLIAVFVGVVVFLLRPTRCPRCREKMTMLGEAADDAYLKPSEKVEERIGSLDYQIWVCPACGEVTKRQALRFSGYKRCPECSARTLRSSSWTIETATYSHGGQVQVEQTCANCPYSHSYVYATPMLIRPRYEEDDDYRRSSASSFFSSPVSSDSSSSSASSGSDFGGGHSSGDGASGHW